MNKWLNLLKALRKGAVLADAATIKNRQVFVSTLVATGIPLFYALKSFGVIPESIDESTVTTFLVGAGGVIYALYVIITTWSTSDKVGILKPKSDKIETIGVEVPYSKNEKISNQVDIDNLYGPDPFSPQKGAKKEVPVKKDDNLFLENF